MQINEYFVSKIGNKTVCLQFLFCSYRVIVIIHLWVSVFLSKACYISSEYLPHYWGKLQVQVLHGQRSKQIHGHQDHCKTKYINTWSSGPLEDKIHQYLVIRTTGRQNTQIYGHQKQCKASNANLIKLQSYLREMCSKALYKRFFSLVPDFILLQVDEILQTQSCVNDKCNLTPFITSHIQIPLTRYVGLIQCSTATANWSSCKGAMQLLHCTVAPVGVAAAYPHSYSNFH